jgi:hypothetical protein
MDASVTGTTQTSVQTQTVNKAMEVQEKEIVNTAQSNQDQVQAQEVDTSQKTGMGKELDAKA